MKDFASLLNQLTTKGGDRNVKSSLFKTFKMSTTKVFKVKAVHF